MKKPGAVVRDNKEPIPPGDPSFSVASLAKADNVSRSTIYNEFKAGRLKFLKVGRRVIITGQQRRDWHQRLADEMADAGAPKARAAAKSVQTTVLSRRA